MSKLALFVANQAAPVTPITADDTPIVLDSGCSITISNDPLDFPEGYTPAPPDAVIRGVGSTLAVHGHGLITADDTPAAALPGDFVATDQMVSPIGGLTLFHTGQRNKRP